MNIFLKHKKKFAFILAGCILLSVFSGCEKSTEQSGTRDTIVSIGAWPNTAGEQLERYKAQKIEYEKANPDILIEPDTWTFDRMTFYAKAEGGQLPTLYGAGYTEIPEILSNGYSADLTSVLKKRGYDGMFREDILELVSMDGKIYALPTASFMLGLAFNTEILEKAGLMEEDGTPKQPKDWLELAEFAVKIKKATGVAGFVFPTANKYGGWIFTCLAWSYGVDFIKQDENGRWVASFDTAECAEALQYVKDLKWKYDVLPENNLIDGNEYYKIFATGKVGMMIAAEDVSERVVVYDMEPDSLGMMALPSGPKKHVTLLGGGVKCINPNATEKQIDGAIRWVEMTNNYKLTEEYQNYVINKFEEAIKNNTLVGIKGVSPFNSNAESVIWYNQKIDEYANSNINHVRLYNEFVENCPAEIKLEEPLYAQELYAILDECVQKVLVDKEADCSEIIKKAASDFQINYLNGVK